METWRALKELCQEIGVFRVAALFLVIGTPLLAFAALSIWLAERVGWPEDYGFQCRRKCVVSYMWHSPALLRDPSAASVALFVLIWAIPAGTLLVIAFVLVRRKLKAWKQRIRPMSD